MKSLGEIVEKNKKDGRRPPNSQRARAVVQVMILMGEDKTTESEREMEYREPGLGRKTKKERIGKRIKYWFGRTKKLHPDEIFKMISQSKTGKNKQSLFNYLLKQRNAKK